MFRKLMKYDNRALGRMMLPLFGASIIASIIMAVALPIVINIGESSEDPSLFAILIMMGASLLIFAMWMVLALAYSGSYILVGVRYYRNFISDEGYLTFTLPVTPAQLLKSKLLSGFLWQLIATVVFILNIGIILASMMPMLLEESGMTLSQFFGDFFAAFGETGMVAEIIGLIATMLIFTSVMVMLNLCILFLALTLGGVLAQKHKAIAGIGLYIALNTAVGFIIQICYMIFMPIMIIATEGAQSVTLPLIAVIVFLLVCSVLMAVISYILYRVIRYLLTHKLNLQ